MEWIERLNNAVTYIEDNLKGNIDIEEASKIACCSTYHFQRMFAYIAEVPLSEYIRRRRMSLAAVNLKDSSEKVIDVALKYGYDSPTAFTRAFKSVHGISPSQAKNEGVILKAFPPISFKITIKGAIEMNYRIEKKESFRIVGISHKLDTDLEKNFKIVPEMWSKAVMDGTLSKLSSLMNSEPMGILGVSSCNPENNWRYYIAAASTKEIDDSLEEFIVPGCTWAIFAGQGTNKSIQELEKRIVTEWLPTSGYEYADGPDIEVYFNADPENAKYEVWIPVIKKVD